MVNLLNNLLEKTGYFLEDLFAFISSPRCPGCDQELESPRLSLCPNCESDLNFVGDGPVCLLCRSPEGVACNCQDSQQFPVPRLYYWAPYTAAIRTLIHRFKFEGQRKLGNYLTLKALSHLHERMSALEPDLIIPVPMLKRDKRKRTFNQTELMAQLVSEQLRVPVMLNSLRKIRATRLQANLGREERWRNIRGVFDVDKPSEIADQFILVVDDIVTTGATCLEASQVLYSAGAKSITVFSLASSHHDDLACLR